MSLNIQNANYYKQNNFNGVVKHKREEAGLNPKRSIAITFGWSKNVQAGSVEEKILDALTDPKNKSAVIATHTRSDGDAYGSNIGIAGILNNMGVKVFSVVDDFPQKQFTRMPSIREGLPATRFITRPDYARTEMSRAGIKQPDLAVITDCPLPGFTQGQKSKVNNVLDLVFDAKKFIIIDHHPDTEGQPTNEQQWVKDLKDRGVKPENILYWREPRPSAAEMIGELDKEIAEENQKNPLPNYKMAYPGYKIAIASGMFKDAGGTDNNKGQVKFARLSPQKVPDEKGTLVSISRQIFDWLIKTCGKQKTEVNLNETTTLALPAGYKEKLHQIVNGQLKIEGITVKNPTKSDPLGYIFLENWNGIEKLTDEINRANWAEGKRSKEDKIYSSDVYKEIKEKAQMLDRNKDLGLFLLISKITDKETRKSFLSMIIRSYGFNTLEGEMYQKGHVFVDQGAKQVIDTIKDKGLGDGGGHANAGGMKINEGIDFYKGVLPVINEALKASNPTRTVPKDFKGEVVNFTGAKKKPISLFG